LILIIFVLYPHTSSSRVGYSLNVDVNGTTWSRSQSTNVLSFQSDSDVSGKGNCSKYTNIHGFAGNGLKDNIYAKDGSITNSNKISIKSIDRWIHIEQSVDNNSNHYLAEINESLPTIVTSKEELYYKGKGMYSSGVYLSGSDAISLNYQGTLVSKSINFGGFYSNANILVDITPGQILASDLTNKSMALSVSSMSDKLSGISYNSDDIELDQTYRGFYKIDTKFVSRSQFNLDQLEGSELPCCQLKQTYPFNYTSKMDAT
jgi:hypothetical protein